MNRALEPTERFAQQQEKVINKELQQKQRGIVMLKGLLRGFCSLLLVTLGSTAAIGLAQKSDAMVYENHNQIDPKPLRMHIVHGTATAENGSVVPEMQLGLFAEKDHSLVATAKTGQNGEFSFARIPAGRYRLVAKHPASVPQMCGSSLNQAGVGAQAKHSNFT